MKKVVIISSYYYAHIDVELIPILSNYFEISWFVIFGYTTKDNTISDFLNRVKHIQPKSYVKLSGRMRSLSIRKDYKMILSEAKKCNPDVVYFNDDGFPWLPILSKKIFKDIPIIAAIHDVEGHSGSGIINKIIKSILYKWYTYLNTFSDYSYQLLSEKVSKAQKVFCCHHPLTDFGVCEKRQHDKFTLLFFGNILAYKGVALLLKAGENAYNKNSNICIKICGKGHDEYLLESYKTHPAFTIINRRVEDSEIPDIFSDADCLVLPYNDATQSGPMMIALNYGIPVLATDIPAFKWFGERFSNVHLLKNNIDVWANEFIKYSENYPNIFINREKYNSEIDSFRTQIQQEWINLFEKFDSENVC